jgi:Holliday junction resolvasome RuvABC endonuclease subunit
MATTTLAAPTRFSTPPVMLASSSRSGALLALDLGTTTGWALKADDEYISSGTLSLKSSRYDGGGMRYLRLRRWLDELQRDAGPIGAIHFEEVRRHIGTDAAHVYGGMLGVLSAWCEEHGVAYQGVPVGTIKAFATGKGNADKAAVIAAVQARGFSPLDDNEADAIAILLWAIETGGGVR